ALRNATEFLICLSVRRYVLEGCYPATRESNYLARVGDTWRNVRIIEWIVERIAEITPGPVRRIIRRIVNVKPSLRRTSTHVAHNFSVRRTPRQPHSGS